MNLRGFMIILTKKKIENLKCEIPCLDQYYSISCCTSSLHLIDIILSINILV